ncbi:MAG: tyrosine-protein phosphatase [Lachnospiraceae bacterium]
MNIIRLPLEGTSNTRDLGGYVTKEHKLFKWKRALRSDCLSRLEQCDTEFLAHHYDLKKVIDLRSPQEVALAPNPYQTMDDVEYHNISLADDVDPNMELESTFFSENFLRDFYVSVLEDKKANLKKIIMEISDVEKGSVIFHCTAGKDRTGVIAMLLLGICGVSKQDIATNYMQTAVNLRYHQKFEDNLAKLMQQYKEVLSEQQLQKISSSNERDIEYTYDTLIERYGSFWDYFLEIGFTALEIETLKKSLTEDIN